MEKWAKSEGRLDAAKVHLMGPDPNITVAFLIEGAPFVRLPDALVAIATML